MERWSIGPVWETDPEKLPLPAEDLHQTPQGFWVPKPTRSLGYAAIVWGKKHVLQPDGPDKGKPYALTPEQIRFVLWWYAIDGAGVFVYPSGMLMRMKGAGKDPLGAFLCLVELLGPCRFAGWREDGTPRVVPHPNPWVAVTAVSQEQTGNTMKLLPSMVSDATREKYGIEALKEVWYTTSGQLQAFASSYRALEGKRTTFTLMNETHHWVASNAGHDMAETIEDNHVKGRDGSARTLAITNAHVPGEDSVAERMWDGYQDWLAGRLVQEGPPYLVDALQAPPDTDLADDESLRRGILAARGDAHWLDIDRIMARVRDPRMPPSRARRMYLNQVVAAEDAFVTAPAWDANERRDVPLRPGEEIVMFFDGSKNDDATGLMACRMSDGLLSVLGVWEKPRGPAGDRWEVDKAAVDLVVREVMETYDVIAFWGDVIHFEGLHDAWSQEFGPQLLVWAKTGKFPHATAFDMRSPANVKMFTEACERFEADVRAGEQPHDGDRRLRQHVLNARRRPNRYGVSIGKEHRMSAKKVDLAVCAVGASMLRRLVLASPAWQKRRKRSGRAVFI